MGNRGQGDAPRRWWVRDRSRALRRDEEKALLDAALGGDAEAIEELIDRYQPSLVPIAGSYFGDHDEALGCVHEFWAVYLFGRRKASLARWDGRCRLKTWLSRLMGRFALHCWRKANRDRALSELELEVPESPAESPEGLVVLRVALERCKEELSPLLRSVFDMVEGGWEQEDISVKLGKKRPTVAVCLYRARRALIECIGR